MGYLPALPDQRIKVFDHVAPEDERSIWRHGALEIELFVKTLCYTGLRISEAQRLRTTDHASRSGA